MVSPQDVQDLSVKLTLEREGFLNAPFTEEETQKLEHIIKFIDSELLKFKYQIYVNDLIYEYFDIGKDAWKTEKYLYRLIKLYLQQGWYLTIPYDNNYNLLFSFSNFSICDEHKKITNIDDYELGVFDNRLYALFPKKTKEVEENLFIPTDVDIWFPDDNKKKEMSFLGKLKHIIVNY